ncbi:hypothetical protein SAMN02746041_00012 [Desulfacinum hydrothermale DSM 13146]|uniref:Uncharacterized protein n=1 Tax=Desulfacinum hydrothermale DSM 13146 TaxID=1121390 RepID=A0A1W1WWM9_9BACT|nr:hypothetical protein [Desulfacinum hydrothermale]SMC16146.1 hypothetical protein SAMN02746041_00012 [Desulfacinum hydrothermale DSM 13146]
MTGETALELFLGTLVCEVKASVEAMGFAQATNAVLSLVGKWFAKGSP